MGYLKRYGRNRLRAGLGDAITTVTSAASDPYLSEVICRVGQLMAIDDKTAVPSCAKTRDGLRGGVGMRKAIKPLRAYVYAEQRPWVYPVALVGLIGLPMLIGYSLGRSGS